TEIPSEVREEIRLARARYVAEPNWREKPLDRYERYGERAPAGATRGRLAPAPSPAKRDGSVNSVLSFFKEGAPVQFDPSAIRATRPQESGTSAELKRGARVRHDQFGVGTILTMEGSGPEAKVTVYFDRVGSKKFIAKYAKLTRA